MEPSTRESPSLSDQAARLLADVIESHALIRILGLIALAWVWLTLLGFTLGLSREVATSATGRLPALYLGAQGDRTAVAAIVLTLVASLLIIPAVLVWNYLVRLTRLLAHLATNLVRWDPSEREHEYLVVMMQEGLGEAIQIFMRWFSLFVLTWILILVAGSLGTIITLVLQLIQSSQ